MTYINSSKFLQEYLSIACFFGVAILLALVIIALPSLLAKSEPNINKLQSYECGFEPFGDARMQFDIRFYLLAMLFIIFDIEIIFLIPWAISLGKLGMYGFWSMAFFLFTLTIGLIYEWQAGALDW